MSEENKSEILNPGIADSDELSLRPQTFDDYIGQKQIKDELSIYTKAAIQRNEALDHVLLYGPPGLGKTTLAMIIANEMNASIKSTSGPAIEKTGDLVALLNEFDAGDVLFIDEIHRLPKQVEEVLYSAMEDYYIDIIIGQNEQAQSIHFNLAPFTLIGATTRAGLLSAPLRDRFGIVLHMDYYSVDDLSKIIKRSSNVLSISIEDQGAIELGRRSRGTPRIANRLLKRVRDFGQIQGKKMLDQEIVASSLNQLKVDTLGLDGVDSKYLTAIIERFAGGPAGLSAIASSIGESPETIEEMVEPYLMQLKFIQRTNRGRIVTPEAYKHLKIDHQGDLI